VADNAQIRVTVLILAGERGALPCSVPNNGAGSSFPATFCSQDEASCISSYGQAIPQSPVDTVTALPPIIDGREEFVGIFLLFLLDVDRGNLAHGNQYPVLATKEILQLKTRLGVRALGF
jgi:hypothetical protein